MTMAAGAGRLAIGVLAAACMIGVEFATPAIGPLRSLEALSLDLRFQLRGPVPPGEDLALVLVDERSIRALGRWPWSRQVYADLVDRLAAGGASVIAFDLLFTEPGAPEADAALAAAMRRAGNVLLPMFLAADARADPGAAQAPALDSSIYKIYRAPPGDGAPVPISGRALSLPIPVLLKAAAGIGHVNLEPGPGGTTQYEHVAVAAGGTLYPSLAVMVAARQLGLSNDRLRFDAGSTVSIGQISVPLDEASRLPVNWLGPRGSIGSLSVVDVLDGNLPPDAFRGRAVLIGGDAVGVSRTFKTPFGPALPAVERHATVADTILRQDFLRHDGITDALDLALVLAGGILAALIGAFAAPIWGAASAVLLAAAAGSTVIYAFLGGGLWLSFIVPVATPIAVYGAVALFGYFRQHRDALRIQSAFAHYLHPALVERLVRDPAAFGPGGERRELTVLFSDIRGFSRIAERLAPEQLVGFMTDYLSAMTEIVIDEQGLLDKYIGDGIMAVFGAPMALPDQAERACRTSLRMIEEVQRRQEQWRRWGVDELRIGVGINTGPMIVGNIGSVRRFEYTVLGDEVNIAARLESLTKTQGADIVISEATFKAVGGGISAKPLGVVPVHGREQPVRIYALHGLNAESPVI